MTESSRPPFDPAEILLNIENKYSIPWCSMENLEILSDFIAATATRETPAKFEIFCLHAALQRLIEHNRP